MAKLRKTNASSLLALALALALLVLSVSSAAEVKFSGYAKSFALAMDSVDAQLFESPRTYQSQNSVRFMLEGFGDNTVWQIHYEITPVFVSRELPFEPRALDTPLGSYRFSDPDLLLAENGSKQRVYQNLDRFNVQFQFDQGDLTIGRQAIAFGSARIISPPDIFLPFNEVALDTEYRSGVDAIRFQRPVGQLGEIDMGIVLGDGADRDTSAAFLRMRNNYRGMDLQLSIVEYADQFLAGAGLETALGDFGFWFDIASVTGDEDYVRASTGLDYTFSENLLLQVEYHYNGAGTDQKERYLARRSTLPYQRGGVFLLGEHYLIPVLSVQPSPLWSLLFGMIYNFSDQSRFTFLTSEYNARDNLYMDFGIYHFSGDKLEVLPNGLPVLQSEYGDVPTQIYTSLRYYF